jgi:hypothetical protein
MIDDPERARQKEVNERISRHVPSRAWESTVAIVIATPPLVRLLGTGVLFQIADCPFVVTAGHVFRTATQYQKTVGLGDTGDDSLVPLVGGTCVSSVPPDGLENDPHDVAVYRLPPDEAAKLHRKRYLRIGDVSFADPGPKAIYSLFGYPGAWTEPSRSADDRFIAKPFEFTTYAYDGDTSTMIGYQARLHLLLSAGTEYATWPDGSPADFRDRLGQRIQFPRGLKGISGASVWHVGDLAVPIEKWNQQPPRVVGLDTGVYHASGAITASRWIVVTTLIHSAFPDLRRSIELWTP